ncbi:ATP12 family chaperone protein [Hansschlegelia beijingensis]|uniref:Chaperone required for assembly of F1-ATPase n=1 Tax=Hansschlegelia beijingensis TaxID=1133344 RepID=A0A7W6D4L0_9HYPH|nr:ATP12 family protein [Hansschlegelia beijingensis]MBB3972059.1 chaperone required for assembly of F1-ATPase [Hansschlegelia beijingensis]
MVEIAPEALGKAPLPKRFYTQVEVLDEAGRFFVTLDRRKVRTPAKAALTFASPPLAEAVAEEWRAQQDVIDPRTMPLTRIANVAIDGVAPEREAVLAEIVKYASSDLVCYRADMPDRLVARQTEHWDPVLAFARDDLGARFVLAQGVMFVDQPEETLEAVRRALPRDDHFVLAALSTMTTLTGSALLALGVLRGWHTVEQAWAAANVDEGWNADLWGHDAEAAARQEARRVEMEAAARMIALSLSAR